MKDYDKLRVKPNYMPKSAESKRVELEFNELKINYGSQVGALQMKKIGIDKLVDRAEREMSNNNK